jgi:hypothetical protein
MNNSKEIELEMFLKLADEDQKEWSEQEEQEKEFFGNDFASFLEKTKNKDLREMIKVFRQTFYSIRRGEYRMAAMLDDMFVLKLAKNSNGVILNQREANLVSKIFPKVYNTAPNYEWIVVERAREFDYRQFAKFFPELEKKGFVDVLDYFLSLEFEINDQDSDQDSERDKEMSIRAKAVKPGIYLKQIKELYDFYPQAALDFHNGNFGVVTRKGGDALVLIDAGLHKDL